MEKNWNLVSTNQGRKWGNKILNPYELFIDENNIKVIKMSCNNGSYFIYLDLDDYNIINNYAGKIVTYYVNGNKYVQFDINNQKKYLHHKILNFQGNGKGFRDLSVDHIDRNPLNNRKCNLRLATMKEQRENTKGSLPNTKRNRKINAQKLPEGLKHEDMPKYIVYYNEKYAKDKFRNFFRIEKHPAQLEGIVKNKWSTTKSMNVCIKQKLELAKEKLKELDNLI